MLRDFENGKSRSPSKLLQNLWEGERKLSDGKLSDDNQKGQSGAPETVLKPSRLEGQLMGLKVSDGMLQRDGEMMNF